MAQAFCEANLDTEQDITFFPRGIRRFLGDIVAYELFVGVSLGLPYGSAGRAHARPRGYLAF